jgi:copper homeostasis protein CutC
VEAVGLVVEKKKLENIIKEVNDRALTQGQKTRVDEINNRLEDLAAEAQVQAQSIIPGEVVDKAQDLLQKAAGVKNIVDPDLGVTPPPPRAPRADALAIQYQQVLKHC